MLSFIAQPVKKIICGVPPVATRRWRWRDSQGVGGGHWNPFWTTDGHRWTEIGNSLFENEGATPLFASYKGEDHHPCPSVFICGQKRFSRAPRHRQLAGQPARGWFFSCLHG